MVVAVVSVVVFDLCALSITRQEMTRNEMMDVVFERSSFAAQDNSLIPITATVSRFQLTTQLGIPDTTV